MEYKIEYTETPIFVYNATVLRKYEINNPKGFRLFICKLLHIEYQKYYRYVCCLYPTNPEQLSVSNIIIFLDHKWLIQDKNLISVTVESIEPIKNLDLINGRIRILASSFKEEA